MAGYHRGAGVAKPFQSQDSGETVSDEVIGSQEKWRESTCFGRWCCDTLEIVKDWKILILERLYL